MVPLAHSARPKLGIPAQPYVDHARNVMDRGRQNATAAGRYAMDEAARLLVSLSAAAEFHDLGKLDPVNQQVLRDSSGGGSLPIHHQDAGVAHLLHPQSPDFFAALLTYAHHIGLPDLQEIRNSKPGYVLRDTAPANGGATKDITDHRLAYYLLLHRKTLDTVNLPPKQVSLPERKPLRPLLLRIALSCLVDADHYDTAKNYNEAVASEGPLLHAAERLAALDMYVRDLSERKDDSRTHMRKAVYEACRTASTVPGMLACDSPVGTGKTTAVMAHLLRAAADKNLRRIVVVLPFTNIIDQSVEVYRRALILPGENPDDVVAAHHHRAEFSDLESRQFAYLWHAPMIVTTAVQFFETLASNMPGALRKLHQLPGSAIFIDEAHAALPTHLWPQAWRWLRELQDKWCCHFVLGSGSLTRFWELDEFSQPPMYLPELVLPQVREAVGNVEKFRVQYHSRPDPLGLEDLLKWLHVLPAPRLLIINTVQSAAVFAKAIMEKDGCHAVEHLSTSLCPADRRATLERVRLRLRNKFDTRWTLVATSCVEAGVDLSFCTGLRERCSLNSLIQMAGRVSRNNEFPDAEVWDFQLQHTGLLRGHPAFKTSGRILGEMFQENAVHAQSSTEAMRREVTQDGTPDIVDEILKAERESQFPIVEDKFKVIDTDTVTVIVNREIAEALEHGEKLSPNELQAFSVQIWRSREVEYALGRLARFPELRTWKLRYDPFLGYMAGVLESKEFVQGKGAY